MISLYSDFRMTLKWKRANKTETTNDFIGLSNGYKRARLLVGWANARVKKRHTRELSRNQPIPRFDVILQHDWPIEQCLLHTSVFLVGKTKRLYLDLFIHWLIKQITNTYRNYFSRSYENRSFPHVRSLLLHVANKLNDHRCKQNTVRSFVFLLKFLALPLAVQEGISVY